MKKLFTTMTALVFLTAVLSGCSAKENTNDTSSAAATEAATEAAKTEAPTEAEETKSEVSSGDAAEFVGKWQATDVTVDGETMENYYGADAFTLAQIEHTEDNKGTFFSFLFNWDETPYEINWELKEDVSVELTAADPDYNLINGTLTKSESGLVYTMAEEEGEYNSGWSNSLARVDEFTPIPEDTEISLGFSTEDLETTIGVEWEFSIDGDEISVEEVTSE